MKKFVVLLIVGLLITLSGVLLFVQHKDYWQVLILLGVIIEIVSLVKILV